MVEQMGSPEKGFVRLFRRQPNLTNIHPANCIDCHSKGIITINVLEADPAQRAAQKAANKEVYRTVLGHMRHGVDTTYGICSSPRAK